MDESIGKEKVFGPFSNGTQFLDWREVNCVGCKKSYDENGESYKCDIEMALDYACVGSGKVSEGIARRMGYLTEEGERVTYFVWQCTEVEFTETRKALLEEIKKRKKANV